MSFDSEGLCSDQEQQALGFANKDNRASRLRQQYLEALRAMNVHSVLTKFEDYRAEVRPHRPSNSARYPRTIQTPKSWVDPEWDHSEYDVYVFNSRMDEKWADSWIKNVLESKRYHVKINSTRSDLSRLCGKYLSLLNNPQHTPNYNPISSMAYDFRFLSSEDSRARLVFILSPDLIGKTLKRLPLGKLQEDMRRSCSILVVKIRSCETPEMLKFTNYMDLSFSKMDDLTLQCQLLPKLVTTLQLPKSVCS